MSQVLREPARPTGRWMLQHARRMLDDPLGFLLDSSRELGDVVEFPIPRQPVFYVDDPEAAQRVLQGNHRGYGKRTIQYDALALVTGEGLLVVDPPRWRETRRLVQPAFHPRTLEALAGHVADAADALTREWTAATTRGTAVVDVDDAMMRTALQVVGQALFSTDLSSRAEALVGSVLEALECVVARARSPLPVPLAVPTPRNLRLRSAVAHLDTEVARMVAERQRHAPGTGDDLLGLLLASLPDAQAVRDEVVTLVVAGHETVASALTWAWWLLSDAAEAADRLADEAVEVLGDRRPTLADYPRLPYARAVLDEALRLYPPAWVITRRALDDDVLAGVAVPKDALVILSTYTLHRHPSAWPDPERFDPERFHAGAGEEASARAAPPGAYLPFGAGPRLCIGRDFALVEGTLLLAALARSFRLERTPGQRVAVDPLVTLRPRGGLPLEVRRQWTRRGSRTGHGDRVAARDAVKRVTS